MTKMKNHHRTVKYFTAALSAFLVCSQAPAAWAQVSVSTERFRETDPELLFEQGMEARKIGRVYSSIDAFEEIVKNYPDLHRARLELAVSYYRTFNFDGALEQAQFVLDDPDTPPNVRVTILAFMAQVQADKEKFVLASDWSFPLSFGYMYDSNVSAGADSARFGNLILDDASTKKSDSAAVFNVGIDHVLKTGKTFRAGEYTANLLWKSMVNIYHREYVNETDFNLSVLSFKTGPAVITTGRWRSGLDAQVDVISYGGMKLATFSSLTPVYTWHFENGIEVSGECLFSRNNYDQPEDEGRTSDYISPKISAGYVTTDNKFIIQGAVSYFNENAKADHKTNDGNDYFLGGTWNVLENSSVFTFVRYRDYEYEGIEPFFAEARDDDEWRYSVGATHTLKDMGMMTDWFITALYTRTEYDSNVPIYDYDRDQYMLTLNRRF